MRHHIHKYMHACAQVTSVQLSPCGTQLLVSAKDNSVRLWDVRAARVLHAFKGHQNTSKNFVRARFAVCCGGHVATRSASRLDWTGPNRTWTGLGWTGLD